MYREQGEVEEDQPDTSPSASSSVPLSNDEMRMLNQRFVRALAHDLKEPARSISGFTEILLTRWETLKDSQRQEFLSRTNAAALRLLDMIQELRSFALESIGSARVPIIPIKDAILSGIETEKGDLDNAGGELTLTLALSSAPTAGVPASISRVIRNLVNNSVKYAGEKPPDILLKARILEGDLVVEVRDQGMGFKQESSDYIFEPFHRLTPHKEQPGLGMGLAICQEIIHQHGGRIWAESEGPGKGACFTFRLPVHEVTSDEADSSPR